MVANNILIGGNAYGYGNIGDDAVLKGILMLLRDAVPHARLHVETAGGKRLASLSDDDVVMDAGDLDTVMRSIRSCDCFISGGGTMIGDELGTSFPLVPNAKRMAEAKYLGKGVIMLGIGANVPQTPEGSAIARLLTTLSDVITVRDEGSRNVCLSLGANSEHVHVTADPAFVLRAKETPRTRELKARIRAKHKTIGVNVVNEAWRNVKGYKQAIAEACNTLAKHSDYVPFFFCNEIRTGERYDQEANAETASMMQCKYEMLPSTYYTPEEMIDIISAFDTVLSMRMHALIFAAMTKTPFVTISRVDKVDHFMQMFGLQASGSIEDCRADQLADDIQTILGKWSQFGPVIEKKVTSLRTHCRRNVDILRSALRKRSTFRPRITDASLKLASSHTSDCTFRRNLRYVQSGHMAIHEVALKGFNRVIRIARNRKP